MNYNRSRPRELAVFSDPARVWADFDEKVDSIAAAHHLERYDPSLLAKDVMEAFDVMPYTFVSTMEHALF